MKTFPFLSFRLMLSHIHSSGLATYVMYITLWLYNNIYFVVILGPPTLYDKFLYSRLMQRVKKLDAVFSVITGLD